MLNMLHNPIIEVNENENNIKDPDVATLLATFTRFSMSIHGVKYLSQTDRPIRERLGFYCKDYKY